MEWELRRRTDEIVELQNALSESNISLNTERKQNIHLTSELENAKLRTKEDRRRLVQLLQLAEPIEQTIKLYYDRRPEKLEKYVNSDSYGFSSGNNYDPDSLALTKSLRASTGKQSLLSSTASKMKRSSYSSKKILKNCANCTKSKKCKKCASISNGLYSPKLEYRIPPSDEKQQIVRTILFPNETTNTSLNDENDYLRKQLTEMKTMYESQILRMEEDRRLREEEMRLRDVNFREKIEDLIKKNQKLERLNYELTKDHMQLKYDSSTNEKKLYEELEMAKLQNEALSVSLKELMNRTNVDKELSKNDYERKTKEITHVMRSQVKNHEENINIIKEQYKQIQKIYTSRVKELESKLKSLNDKYKTLETRRANEIEGYINEINMMRKRLKSYEDYVGKLRRVNFEGVNEETEENTNDFLSDISQTKVIEIILLTNHHPLGAIS